MAELETLIKLLAVQLGDNINLRDALVETMLAFMDEQQPREKQAASQSGYLDLLELVRQQQIQTQKEGRERISSALNILGAHCLNKRIAQVDIVT